MTINKDIENIIYSIFIREKLPKNKEVAYDEIKEVLKIQLRLLNQKRDSLVEIINILPVYHLF